MYYVNFSVKIPKISVSQSPPNINQARGENAKDKHEDLFVGKSKKTRRYTFYSFFHYYVVFKMLENYVIMKKGRKIT